MLLASIWLVLSVRIVFLGLATHGWDSGVSSATQLIIFPMLAAIDLEVRRVPTALVRAGSILTLGAVVASGGISLLISAMGALLLFAAPLILVNIFQPNAIGSGDIRLGVYLGPLLSLGSPPLAVPVALWLACLLTIIVSVAYRIVFRRSLKRIPLVPFILCGVVLVQIMPVWSHLS